MSDETREVLSEAYDKMFSGEASATQEPAPVETTSTATPAVEDGAPPPSTSERPRDEHGRFIRAEKDPETPSTQAKAPPAPKAEGQGKGEGAEPKPAAKAESATPPAAPTPEPAKQDVRAPQSWKPAAREKWAALPPEVQQEVARREREIDIRLKETDAERKTAAEFKQVVAPFEAMIRSQGATPAQAVDRLLRTGYALQHGPPQVKAQLVADIIKGYGVPIETLDQILSGQAPTTSAAVDPNAIAQQVEQRIQAQIRQQAAAAKAQRDQERLTRFSEKHEFFADVRQQMADILTARRVTDPTDSDLEEVYNLACQVHPDISGVLKQREAAKAAQTAKAATERATAAASSVKSNPAGAPKAHPKTRAELLAEKYDELSRR